MVDYSTVNSNSISPYLFLIWAGIGLVVLILIYLFYRKYLKSYLVKRANDLVILEVKVPKKFERQEYENLKTVADITSYSEQFFASLSGLYEGGFKGLFKSQPVISFELVSKDKEIIFFVGTPRSHADLIEKQIQSFYPNASVEPSSEFRIFKEGLEVSCAAVSTARSFVFPIKTFREFEYDSISTITNSLSKIGEGSRAAVQILVRPTSQGWRGQLDWMLRRIQEGKSIPLGVSWYNKLGYFLGQFASSSAKGDDPLKRTTPIQEETLKLLTQKGSKTGFEVQIKILSMAKTKLEADSNLKNIFNGLSQFSAPDRNGFKLYPTSDKNTFLTHYILRSFLGYRKMILNSEELASIYHFPSENLDTPGIRWFMAKRAPVSATLPKEGIILGKNVYRGEEMLVRLKKTDRRRHLYSIGMTGTGKTTFFESMILQDIRAGEGVAVFDPHGELVEKLLGKIPRERAEDVIYFNPSDTARPLGLNLLEWKTKEQKDFLVQEAIQIFYKLFDPNQQGFVGPQFEHWMRNAALTLMEYPGGGTLIEIPKLFTDDTFREERVRALKDPVVQAFWVQQLAKTADFHKSEMYNYFISKFGRFMTNITMRNIIGQAKSAFDLREVMDSGKILLINLAKGEIGEINSNLLGMIFVAKLFTSALSRADIDEDKRRDFYLYVDEFQNFATDTFSSILSEARKFRLDLNITNQYIAQIPEAIRDAIIGNVGTLVSFRVGVPDAEFMAKEFEPVADQFDLNQIDAYNAYVKLLVDNAPTKPFSMQTIKDNVVENEQMGKAIYQLSRLKYGRDITIVEAEIGEKMKISLQAQPNKDLVREAKL